jgi:hypothetical protein
MKTLQKWLTEARGMPEEVKANAMKISQMLLKIEGKKLGVDGISRLKGFIEEAREAYEAIASSNQSFGSLSSKELASISWEPFADAVWTAFISGMDTPEKASKGIMKFNAVAKWLLPLLLPK